MTDATDTQDKTLRAIREARMVLGGEAVAASDPRVATVMAELDELEQETRGE